ncbi:hypothetical protein EYF80_005799 [Liparis tanakae]|uniref:Uncharacterized protein n=1 Tax=Liparis tanakae TaxID=230148 RepID=A0A4Z2J2I2_9TELE|nr:hypothetical protein EYF80_005799 [Liparis tanakae]
MFSRLTCDTGVYPGIRRTELLDLYVSWGRYGEVWEGDQGLSVLKPLDVALTEVAGWAAKDHSCPGQQVGVASDYQLRVRPTSEGSRNGCRLGRGSAWDSDSLRPSKPRCGCCREKAGECTPRLLELSPVHFLLSKIRPSIAVTLLQEYSEPRLSFAVLQELRRPAGAHTHALVRCLPGLLVQADDHSLLHTWDEAAASSHKGRRNNKERTT